jgi:hypothetical protein
MITTGHGPLRSHESPVDLALGVQHGRFNVLILA